MNNPKLQSVMFLSEMCVLDRNSGAAIEMNDWLKYLSGAGYRTSSVTMSLFDGTEEYPFQDEIVPTVNVKAHVGKRIRVNIDGVEHNIFNAGTSIGRNLTTQTLEGFIRSSVEDILRIKPDIVIGYGSKHLAPVRKIARENGAKTIFYLANDSYDASKTDCFDEIDEIVTPSEALADFYKKRFGFNCSVVGNYLHSYQDIKKPTAVDMELRRKAAIITMVNPSLVKGGLFFMQIAAVMEKIRPNYTFVAVESRTQREHLEGFVRNSSKLSNIWWLQRQSDMPRVYKRSALLLMPSMWFEAAGRIVPEAQMHGVPVLAHRVGALPDQVGQGGKLIEIPRRLEGKFELLPTPEEIRPWIHAIDSILSSAKRFREMSDRALKAATNHNPKNVQNQITELLNRVTRDERMPSKSGSK